MQSDTLVLSHHGELLSGSLLARPGRHAERGCNDTFSSTLPSSLHLLVFLFDPDFLATRLLQV